MGNIHQVILHRDSNNAHNYFDYIHYLRCSQNEHTSNYYKRRNKALLKLSAYIIENELTDRQREIFLLHINQKFNNKQIAEWLGINPSTVTRSLAVSFKTLDKAYKHFECMTEVFVD